MTTRCWPSVLAAGLLLTIALTAAHAADIRDDGPPRYQGTITSEDSLLQTLAAGLVGDALGYDANEIRNSIAKTDMPLEDIVPTYMVSYLSGRSFVAVVEKRVAGSKWGDIIADFRVTGDDLEALSVPRDVEITNVRAVPDQVIEDLLVCAAVSEVFDVSPDEIYDYYQDGWTSVDVMAAAELAYRSRATMASLLQGKAVRVDWYREARRLGVDLVEVARKDGRCFDNRVPILTDRPRRGDLGTAYAADLAVEIYSVPLADVQRLRYRYLLAPSEVMEVLYVSRTCGRSYWEVARLYSWDHWHRWAPVLVVLRVPMSHFAHLGIWHPLPPDYYVIDPWEMDRVLLGLSLSFGGRVTFDFYYTNFYPWYDPWDPFFYCGLHYRHGIGWHDYDAWRHEGRGWWDHPRIHEDWGQWRRSRDWADGRVVGVVVGDHNRDLPHRQWDRPPQSWDRAFGMPSHREPGPDGGRLRYAEYPGMNLHRGGHQDLAGPGQGPEPGHPGAIFGDRGNRSDDRGPNGPDRGPQVGTIDRPASNAPWGKAPDLPRSNYGDRSDDRGPNGPDRGPQVGTIDRPASNAPWGKAPDAPRADFGQRSNREQERSQWYDNRHETTSPPAYRGWPFGRDYPAPIPSVPLTPDSSGPSRSWFGGRDWGTRVPQSTPDPSSQAPVVRSQPSAPSVSSGSDRNSGNNSSASQPSAPSRAPSAPSAPRPSGFGGRHH